MNDRTSLEKQLEQLAHQALRDLPPCTAPASLEARVLHEIERRADSQLLAGISRWPRTARALLIAACALCVPLAWMLAAHLREHVAHALTGAGVGHVVRGVRGTSRTILDLGELAVRLAHAIPSDWLFAGLLVIGAAYAMLLALGYLLLYPTLPHSKAHTV
ncbi:MAG: hypothetical protein ACP5P4_06145 [Steroidobacteraceae bacterium]